MIWRSFLIAALAAALAGCGSSAHDAQTTTSRTATPRQMTLTIFEVVDGRLRARAVQVQETRAVAAAALGALEVEAPVTIDAGTATVGLDSATPEQQAEIVYTLTQFPTVQRVDVGGRKGLTRADVAAFVPPILVEAPAAGAEVASTISVSGSASVFEATLVVELRQDGKVVKRQTVTASEGAPARGTFSTTLVAPNAGLATVAAYSPSAADGRPQHEQDVPVVVRP
jgi:immunoglobulin-like protein involved in spore germination